MSPNINSQFMVTYYYFSFLIFAFPSYSESPNAHLQLDSNIVLNSIPFIDKNDKCGLVIRRINHGEFGSSPYRSEIQAGFYSVQKTTSQSIWKLRDFNSNPLETIEYSHNQYRLLDVDSNGQTDVFLWYSKVSDGLDPDTLKLFLYVNGIKYGNRGRIPKLGGDLSLYESKPDANNSKASPEIRRLIQKQWEILVKPQLEALKVEAIE